MEREREITLTARSCVGSVFCVLGSLVFVFFAAFGGLSEEERVETLRVVVPESWASRVVCLSTLMVRGQERGDTRLSV